jgi:DNA-binding CsgD family transcriptional regulator
MRGTRGPVLDWRLGFRAESLAGLRRVAGRVGGMGAVSAVVFVLVDMAQVAAECDDPEVAREAAAGLERALRDTDVRLFLALGEIGRSWSRLACGEAGDAATSARRALEALSDYRLPFWTARGQEALGRALWASGDSGALQALQAAEAGFAACGAAWRHGRVIEAMRGLGATGRRAAAGALGPSSLTRREREVARLAAHGRTARQIAERLCIGERTVEAHLGSVYAKLGVSSKLELVRREAEFQL